MMKGSFSLTADLLKDIFVEAIDATVQDISSFFEIVDEELITFTLILKTKNLISEKNELIKQTIIKDIINVIQANSIRRADHYGIKHYVV